MGHSSGVVNLSVLTVMALLSLTSSATRIFQENESQWFEYDNQPISFTKSSLPNRDMDENLQEQRRYERSLTDITPSAVIMWSEDSRKCRSPDGQYLPMELFALDTCARCYRYMPDQPSLFWRNTKWGQTSVTVRMEPHGTVYYVTYLVNQLNNMTEAANITDDNAELRATFANLKAEEKWRSCCLAAIDCCKKMLLSYPSPAPDLDENDRKLNEDSNVNVTDGTTVQQQTKYCPPTWDGWTCWQQTEADHLALAQCPHYIYFETEPPACTRYAEKMCTRDGVWYRRGEKGASSEKTNYIPCSPVGLLKQRTNVHVIAYAISTATLLPALLIFYSYKYVTINSNKSS